MEKEKKKGGDFVRSIPVVNDTRIYPDWGHLLRLERGGTTIEGLLGTLPSVYTQITSKDRLHGLHFVSVAVTTASASMNIYI